MNYDVSKGSKKNNKVSKLVSTEPTIELKHNRNKSAKDDLKNNKIESGLDNFRNKSESFILPRKKLDCKGDNNSDCERHISKSDLNCKGPVSENKPCKANINKVSLGRLEDESLKAVEKTVRIEANTSNDDLHTVKEKSKENIKKESVNKGTPNPLKDENIKVLGKEASLNGNTRTSNNDLKTVKEKSKVNIKKDSENKGNPNSMKDENIKVLGKEASLNGNTSTSNNDLKTVKENSKKNKSKTSENKIGDLRNNLLQQQKVVEETFRLIKIEEDKLNENLDQLKKGVSAIFLYNKVFSRQTEIREKKTNQNYNENMRDFFTDIFNLKEKVWKEAGNKPKYSTTKLSNDKQKNLKEKFDCIRNVLKNCGDLAKIVLRFFKFMLEYLEVDESKTKLFFKVQNNLHNLFKNSKEKLHSMFEDIEKKFSSDAIWSDLYTIEDNFNYLFSKFYCIGKNSYKSLVEDEYVKYAEKA